MRIILAEDDETLRRALVKILKLNNCSVDAVGDGKTALEYIETINYDLCILDVMMPLMDGISVLKELRKNGNDIPVLILSAKSEIEDKILGLDTGADDYLSKPFNSEELMARLRALLRRKSNKICNDITFGNTTLVNSSFTIKASGEIRLQNKEYQMLEMMLRSPKRVITIEMFMENIWGLDSDTESNVVWVYISNIRKKLSSIKSNIIITSARNLGYYVTTKEA